MPWLIAAIAMIGATAIRTGIDLVPHLGLEAVLFAAIAGRGAVGLLAAEGTKGRLAALVRTTASAITAAAALAAATLAIGTTSPAALEIAQGPWPWEWIALRSPVGPLAVALFVITAACGPRFGDRAHARARLLDDAFLVAIAAAGTIALAGGAILASRVADVRPGLALPGHLPFALLTALVTIVLRRARDRGAATRTAPMFALGVALSSVAMLAAVGWVNLEVPRAIERAIAEVLVVAALLTAARVATARPPERARPLHALL